MTTPGGMGTSFYVGNLDGSILAPIEKAIAAVEMLERGLGEGLPETGIAYLGASTELGEIAARMTAFFGNLGWDGPASALVAAEMTGLGSAMQNVAGTFASVAPAIASQAEDVLTARTALRQVWMGLFAARAQARTYCHTGAVAQAQLVQAQAVPPAQLQCTAVVAALRAGTERSSECLAKAAADLTTILDRLGGSQVITSAAAVAATVNVEPGELQRVAYGLRDCSGELALPSVRPQLLARVELTHGSSATTAPFTIALGQFEALQEEVLTAIETQLVTRGESLDCTANSYTRADDEASCMFEFDEDF